MAIAAIEFQVVDGWEKAPEGITHKDVSAVGVDSQDRGRQQ